MKKSVMFLLIGFLLLTSVIIARAASICPVDEQASLNKIAAAVKAVYEEKEIIDTSDIPAPSENQGEQKEYVPKKTVFKVVFTNIDEKVYVKVTNNRNDDIKVITSADLKDGTYSFDWDGLDDVTQFTYEVYTTNKTSCPGEKYYTGYLVTPMFNDFYNMGICEGITDLYACQKYVTTKMDYEDQYNKIVEYKEKMAKKEEQKNKKWYTKIGDFVKNHKVALIATGSIIVIAGVATVVVRNKRKRVI